jgi:hypothetical protein
MKWGHRVVNVDHNGVLPACVIVRRDHFTPFAEPVWFAVPQTRDDYLAMFLSELGKVRVPTGEGDVLKKALERVWMLSVSELPVLPDVAQAPESWRRVAALHRELAHQSASGTRKLSFPKTIHNVAICHCVRTPKKLERGKWYRWRYESNLWT